MKSHGDAGNHHITRPLLSDYIWWASAESVSQSIHRDYSRMNPRFDSEKGRFARTIQKFDNVKGKFERTNPRFDSEVMKT